MRAIAADALLVLGLTTMTLGVLGGFVMPDVYGRLHAASKAVALGVVSLLAAVALVGPPGTAFRGILVAAFIVMTTPVGAHAIARAAWRAGEPLEGESLVDESPGEKVHRAPEDEA